MLVHKTLARAGEGLEFVLSDDTVDSYGDVIDPKGWDLSNFKRNPIALFGHSSGNPIGTWKDVRVEGGKLIGKLVFAAKGTSARIDELISLVEQGILRAVSVGFMPIKSQPLDPERPYGPQKFIKQELREVSLVSVPANPAALAVAKSLNVSSETMSLAFGEHAETRRRDFTTHGEKAVATPQRKEPGKMKTLAQRIEDAHNELTAKKDRLAELTGVDDIDTDAVQELSDQIDAGEKSLAALKSAEAKIGINARSAAAPAAPGIARRPLGFPQDEVKASDLIFRSALCHFVSRVSGADINKVLDERYPGHEATALVTKADATIATTTTSGWASQLVNSAMQELLGLLSPDSVYPGLRNAGIGVTFNNNQGSITIPSISTDAALAGGFVLEGDPIPVGRFTTASITMTPHKFGIITTMSKEAAKYTTPALESVLRNSILRRTAITLDGLLLDSTAGSTTRPAGLLNGVSATATGYGGGDWQAVLADLNTLFAVFDAANAGRRLVLIMNPAQARKLAMMPGPEGTFGWASQFMSQFTILTSTSATSGRLIAVDAEDFCTATGDTPEFEVSEQATLHMSDAPGEIVTAAGSVNDPIRSMFQTNSIALRMILNLTWKMRRTGMVAWIDGTSW
jgi:HK97 family phage prohead protease/HK97 family phage major capsid protein